MNNVQIKVFSLSEPLGSQMCLQCRKEPVVHQSPLKQLGFHEAAERKFVCGGGGGGPWHVIKMAAMSIYGKRPSKISSRTNGSVAMKPDM